MPWWLVILQDPLEIPVVPLGALEMPWWSLVIARGPQYGDPTWTQDGSNLDNGANRQYDNMDPIWIQYGVWTQFGPNMGPWI